MVIDSSAIYAIVLNEPERQRFIDCILQTETIAISAATLLECKIVALHKISGNWESDLLAVLERLPLAIIPFDEPQASLAAEAYRAFGKGRHQAALNFGDCISYALAKIRNEPLLYKGDDFTRTDIVSALA
jgi:ribonuclease VapC